MGACRVCRAGRPSEEENSNALDLPWYSKDSGWPSRGQFNSRSPRLCGPGDRRLLAIRRDHKESGSGGSDEHRRQHREGGSTGKGRRNRYRWHRRSEGKGGTGGGGGATGTGGAIGTGGVTGSGGATGSGGTAPEPAARHPPVAPQGAVVRRARGSGGNNSGGSTGTGGSASGGSIGSGGSGMGGGSGSTCSNTLKSGDDDGDHHVERCFPIVHCPPPAEQQADWTAAGSIRFPPARRQRLLAGVGVRDGTRSATAWAV